MPGGRPPKYKKEYIKTVDEYLELRKDTIIDDKKIKVQLPTIEGFALFIGVNKTTLYEWEKKHDEFSNALDKIRTEQHERLIDMGLSGDYNPTIAKLVLSANHGMAERTESRNVNENIQPELSPEEEEAHKLAKEAAAQAYEEARIKQLTTKPKEK